jgi:hypothetical protein
MPMRFSLRRMLLLTAAVCLWLAGLNVLPLAWIVWLTSAVFYFGVVLCFSPPSSPI